MLKQENKIETSGAKYIISSDNNETFDGGITLEINPKAQFRNITKLINVLSEEPDIKILSNSAGSSDTHWISLFLKKPVPLFQILYKIPAVQEITLKRYEICIFMQ